MGDERPGQDRTDDRGVQDDRAGEVAAEIVRGRDRIGSSGYGSLLMILVFLMILVIVVILT
jgi:hypothetical protein